MYIYFCIYAIAFTFSNLLRCTNFAYMQNLHPLSKSVHVNRAEVYTRYAADAAVFTVCDLKNCRDHRHGNMKYSTSLKYFLMFHRSCVHSFSCKTVVLWLYNLIFGHNTTVPVLQIWCYLCFKIFWTLWGCIFPLSSIGQSNFFHYKIPLCSVTDPVYCSHLWSTPQTINSLVICIKESVVLW
jgi:hypothetical protein